MKSLANWFRSYNEEAERMVRRLRWFDIKLTQLSAVFVGLVFAKLIPALLELSVWWFVALAVILLARPVYASFFGEMARA